MDIDSTKVGSPTIDVGDTVGCGDSAASAIVMGFLEYKKLMSTKSDSGKDSNGSDSDDNGSSSSSNSNSTTMTTAKAKQLSAKATLALATCSRCGYRVENGAGRTSPRNS